MKIESLTRLIALAALARVAEAQSPFVAIAPSSNGEALVLASATEPQTALIRPSSEFRALPRLGIPVRFAAKNRLALSDVVFHLTTKPGCIGGSSCITGAFSTTHRVIDLSRTPPKELWTEVVQNGVRCQLNSDGTEVMWDTGNSFRIRNLDSGATADLPSIIGSWQLLDDGRVFVLRYDGWSYVARDGTTTSAALTSHPNAFGRISADGRVFVHFDGATLRRLGLDQGIETALASGTDITNAAVSRDGSAVLFSRNTGRTGMNLFAVDRDIVRPVLPGEPITSFAISDDGRFAFCATVRGRIVRADLTTGFEEEWISRTPSFYVVGNANVPGSQIVIDGAGLADRSATAGSGIWGPELDGIQVQVEGKPLAIGAVSPTRIRAQIPFDWPVPQGRPLLPVTVSSQSPFTPWPTGMVLSDFAPALMQANFLDSDGDPVWRGQPLIERVDTGQMLPVRDFGVAGPVRPSERIHLYATGLGPVSPPVETGMPAPDETPARITEDLACSIQPDGTPIEIEFAGLVPGRTGIYRITLKLPAELPAQFAIACRSATPERFPQIRQSFWRAEP